MNLVNRDGDGTKSIYIDLVDEKCLTCPKIKLETVVGYFSDVSKYNKCEHVCFCRDILDDRKK